MTPLKHSQNFAARMGRWSAGHWTTADGASFAFVVHALFARCLARLAREAGYRR